MADMRQRQGITPIAKHFRRGIFIVSCSMLVLYLLITILYTSSSLRQQYLEREYESLDHTLESLDVLFITAENYSKAILSDDVVQDTLTYPGADRNAGTITMRKQISRYMLSNRYFEAVAVYAVNGRSYDSGAMSLRKGSWDGGYAVEEMTWLPLHDAPYILLGNTRPGLVFSLVRPIYDYRSTRKVGVIEICLTENSVTDGFLLQSNNRTFYLVNEDNVIIAHPNKERLLKMDTVPLLDDTALHKTADTYTISRQYAHTGWYLKSATPLTTIYRPIYRMLSVLMVLGLLVICLGVAFSDKTAKAITRGITKLTASVREIGDLRERLPLINTSDETALLCMEFNRMLDKLEQASGQLVEEQRQKRKFQLELLQQQVNPHFLYNTLENISSLAELGYGCELIELVDNVARFYRGVLSKGNVLIPLRSELEIAESYLQILEIRSHARFSHTFEVDARLLNNTCIKLILQPILENSIYHGFSGMDGPGHIRLDAVEEDGCVLLRVTDNGRGMDDGELAAIFERPDDRDSMNRSFGLLNIRQRIVLYFGAEYGMEITSEKGMGTTVALRLPCQERKEEYDDQDIVG